MITARISLIKLKILIDGMDCSQPRLYNSSGGQTTPPPTGANLWTFCSDQLWSSNKITVKVRIYVSIISWSCNLSLALGSFLSWDPNLEFYCASELRGNVLVDIQVLNETVVECVNAVFNNPQPTNVSQTQMIRSRLDTYKHGICVKNPRASRLNVVFDH